MKRSLLLQSSLWLVALFSAFSLNSASAQLVNGGFETGDFTGWTLDDPSMFTNVGGYPAFANSGVYHANLGASGLEGSLSQTFPTDAGASYNLSFFLACDITPPAGPNNFSVFWNGTMIYSVVNMAAAPYENQLFNNLLATGPTSTLEFRFRHDDDFFRLDDVSVSAVPETSTLGLTAFGLGTLGLLLRRRGRFV